MADICELRYVNGNFNALDVDDMVVIFKGNVYIMNEEDGYSNTLMRLIKELCDAFRSVKENFFYNMEEIYKDLNLNDKRGLFDFFAKKDRPRSHSRRAESSSKNKRKEKLAESYDKKLIQSLSLNNIVNKKIDKNGGDKSMSHIANIKNYTFSRYKKNQSYD